MPTLSHQLILQFLYEALKASGSAHGLGTVLLAAVPVRLWEGRFREPDLLFLRTERAV